MKTFGEIAHELGISRGAVYATFINASEKLEYAAYLAAFRELAEGPQTLNHLKKNVCRISVQRLLRKEFQL